MGELVGIVLICPWLLQEKDAEQVSITALEPKEPTLKQWKNVIGNRVMVLPWGQVTNADEVTCKKRTGVYRRVQSKHVWDSIHYMFLVGGFDVVNAISPLVSPRAEDAELRPRMPADAGALPPMATTYIPAKNVKQVVAAGAIALLRAVVGAVKGKNPTATVVAKATDRTKPAGIMAEENVRLTVPRMEGGDVLPGEVGQLVGGVLTRKRPSLHEVGRVLVKFG